MNSYIIYDFDFLNKENMKISKLILIIFIPECPVEKKFIYSNCVSLVKGALGPFSYQFTVFFNQFRNYNEIIKDEITKVCIQK